MKRSSFLAVPSGFVILEPDMSTAQILTELPQLSHADRREIARRLIELEEDTQILADFDRRADANFLLLDALEAEDNASST